MIGDSTALESAQDIKNYCEEHKTCCGCIFKEKTEEIWGPVSGCPFSYNSPDAWDYWSNEVHFGEVEERDDFD